MKSDKILARLNATPVSKDEILRVVEETSLLPESDEPFLQAMATVNRIFGKNFEKVSAVMFRMEALIRILQDEGAPGWTLSGTTQGTFLADEAVFAAAATEPLIERKGFCFERETFLHRVLELAKEEGQA